MRLDTFVGITYSISAVAGFILSILYLIDKEIARGSIWMLISAALLAFATVYFNNSKNSKEIG